MNGEQKARQLRRHKRVATALFLVMVLLYAAMVVLARSQSAVWIGYVRAFAEAAMVGALADWFAVTALFHHPLGLPIPHTNLIEERKQAIGDNLGGFVVDNFLTPNTIRPYIDKVKLATRVGDWLLDKKHQELVLREAFLMAKELLAKLDDQEMASLLARQAASLREQIQLHKIVAQLGDYLLLKGEHQPVITAIARSVKEYVHQNEDLVREKVKGESYFFIPGFVEDKLAAKITAGLERYFEEVETEPNHRLRGEISRQLSQFFNEVGKGAKWNDFFQDIVDNLLSEEKLKDFAIAAWQSIKATLTEELARPDSSLAQYLSKLITQQAEALRTDQQLQEKIDNWVRLTAYKFVLRNADAVAALIANTVGNWKGKDLSEKLELEVGKDLQFIRINGTLVGGLVGLIIHTITELLR